MSWDVLFVAAPPGVTSLDDMPEAELPPLGPRDEVLKALRDAAPAADWTDASWGRLDAGDFSIEFNVGDGDPVESVMLHVRGGDGALRVIQRVSEALQRPAIDCSEGTVIDFASADAAAGFHAWRDYRDKVAGSGGEPGTGGVD